MRSSARPVVKKAARGCSLAIGFAACALSATPPPTAMAAQAVAQTNRIGLVIANSRYANSADALPGAQRDGATVEQALKKVGFQVTLVQDADRRQIENAVKAFQGALKRAGPTAVGLLYYAGHGGADGERKDNYLLPVDVDNIQAANLADRGVGVRWITDLLRNLDERPAIVVVIDACRTTASENARQRGGSTGSNRANAGFDMVEPDHLQDRGYLIAYSTSKGRPASDNGQYAQALADKLTTAGLSLDQVFEQVRQGVGSSTHQLPIERSTLVEKVCLVSCSAIAGGAYSQNATLLETARNDAEAAISALEPHQPEKHCPRPWGTVIELRASAQKQQEMGHPDAAGQTYAEISRRVTLVRIYLDSLRSVEKGRQRLSDLSKKYYDKYREQFTAEAAPVLRPESRKKDLDEIRRLDSEADALAKAGRYDEAIEKLVGAINLTRGIQNEGQRRGRSELKPLVSRNQERNKGYYDKYRDQFAAEAGPLLKPEAREQNLAELMKLDSEAEALARAGRYEDATNKMIDALNLLHSIQDAGASRGRREIPKPYRSTEYGQEGTETGATMIGRRLGLACN